MHRYTYNHNIITIALISFSCASHHVAALAQISGGSGIVLVSSSVAMCLSGHARHTETWLDPQGPVWNLPL